MSGSDQDDGVPFQIGDWVIDLQKAGERGQYTGKSRKAGPNVMVELRYPDGRQMQRPLRSLQAATDEGGSSIESRLQSGAFGKVRDLQRLITFEKLRGTLHEVVYSMEAAQIDFYPYQFKPVLKFINSPTERLIIADEVGLGKTIESALIWMELQARRQAKRLLVVCPGILTEKWKNELRDKFLLDARIVNFNNLKDEMNELRQSGPGHQFVLIASYPGIRPPKRDLRFLDAEPGEQEKESPKVRFLRELRSWEHDYAPFDMVVFDEAHYMRNPATSTFHLGESLSRHNNTSVLCVSATPVNNKNADLASLLRLIDQDFLETEEMFDQLLRSNRPAIATLNALAQTPPDMAEVQTNVGAMALSQHIKESPLFEQFLGILAKVEAEPTNKRVLARAQDIAEKLNLLGGYINRTRRVQVEEGRPVRRPVVLKVEYTPEEMQLYRSILRLVRQRCIRDSTPFHIFRVLGLQLRAASCLPTIAADIRNGGMSSLGGTLEDMAELLAEGIGGEGMPDTDPEDMAEYADVIPELTPDFKELLEYDFEGNDRKFARLLEMIKASNDPKIVIFAFYRGTLHYLERRLNEAGISTAMIHGGFDHDARWEQLDRFKDPRGPKVFLTSEVGSEGIDLQFSHTVINYDLPWNPMRVEQRIGRIDRIGQKSDVLNVVNFKVSGTVEERLYTRLHEKLLYSKFSIGDLEVIIGDEVQQLTIDLLSSELTEEEEAARIDKTERAIENQLLEMKKLEDSGDSLVALSDYVQKKIREDREKGRYIQPEELEDYLDDFLDREFRGSEVNHNTPAEGCMRVRLSPEAQSSLSRFVINDRSLSARPLRRGDFMITFRREAHERLNASDRRSVHFVNHMSPLIKWATDHNKIGTHTIYNVSGLCLRDDSLAPGVYAYRVQRWKFQGLTKRENLVYAVQPLDGGEGLDADQAEAVMNRVLRQGTDWDYPDIDDTSLLDAYNAAGDDLVDRFDQEVVDYEAENRNTVHIRVLRARRHWDRLIDRNQKAIETMYEKGQSPNRIRGFETMLENNIRNKDQKIRELSQGAEIDFETEEIGAGMFMVQG